MSLTDYEHDIIDNVAKYSWHCVSVWGDEDQPPLSYTVGFWETLCTPELIIFGLESELSYHVLWTMCGKLRAGAALSDGARWDLLAGYDCISRPVHPSQVKIEYFNSAMWYRGHKTGDQAVEAYQLFWPEVGSGLFPWERGCSNEVRKSQPLLYLPDGEFSA